MLKLGLRSEWISGRSVYRREIRNKKSSWSREMLVLIKVPSL